MLEFYPQIKSIHVSLVLMSVALFAVRAGFALAGMRWPRHAIVRWTAYTVDTMLVTSAAMLLTVLPGALFANGWLTVKMLLLLVYIVLGVMAMRERKGIAMRAICYVAALATIAFMYGIARLHHPLGWLAPYFA